MTSAPDRAAPFSLGVALALILVGAFAFSAFIALSTFAPELRGGRDGQAHALSRSAIGYAAFVELLRARGDRISVSRAVSVERNNAPLTIFTPDRALTQEEILARATGDVLIVLPKWNVTPSQERIGWVQSAGLQSEGNIVSLLGEVAPGLKMARRNDSARPRIVLFAGASRDNAQTAGAINQLQTFAITDGIETIAVTEDGGVLLARVQLNDNQSLYILSDPDFINTQGLADLETARVALAMIDAVRSDPGDSIVIDVTLNGFVRSASLLRAAFEPPFLGGTLSILAVALMLAWAALMRARPSAVEARAIALGKRSLAENSAALVRLTGRDRRMGWPYAHLTSMRATEHLHSYRPADDPEAIAALDRLGAAHGVSAPFSAIAGEAANARSTTQALAAARKLYAWNEEMTRALR